MGNKGSSPPPPPRNLNNRKQNLVNLDIRNNNIAIETEDYRRKIRILDNNIRTKTNELNIVTNQLNALINDTSNKYANKNTLTYHKKRLTKYKKELEYLVHSSTQELNNLTQYNNLQRRNQPYYDKEYNRLYTKVVVRNQLKHTGYVNRNGILNRTLSRFEQKYSNMHTDSEYQTQHNDYFITINAIFWWVYYLLFIITFYQIVYIQTDMSLIIKIRWLTVLLLFPLLYYVYDLVIMKI